MCKWYYIAMPKDNVYRFDLDAHGFVIHAAPELCDLLGLHFSRKCIPRFDSFIARESGTAFLQSALNAYRGVEVKRVLVTIISKDGEKKYGYLSLEKSSVNDAGLVVGLHGKFELKF